MGNKIIDNPRVQKSTRASFTISAQLHLFYTGRGREGFRFLFISMIVGKITPLRSPNMASWKIPSFSMGETLLHSYWIFDCWRRSIPFTFPSLIAIWDIHCHHTLPGGFSSQSFQGFLFPSLINRILKGVVVIPLIFPNVP